MSNLAFTLNGVPWQLEVAPGESLLDVLRNRCGITSTKDGCAPQAQCGCCLALVDGHPKTTCAVPAEKAHGTHVLTLEGVSAEERELCGRAFALAAGVQCGFCTPGFALHAKWLLDHNPNPTRGEIAKAISGHLCRCTGYVKILDAIELMARARRGEPLPEPPGDGHLGQPLARWRAADHALGQRAYVGDLSRPGMLHGAVVLSAHARARVLAIDVTAAAALPGVAAVLTAEDVPGDRWYGLLYADWPGLVAVGEEVRAVGDVLAVVAAADARTAHAAARLVRVDYEVLPALTDPRRALDPDAPVVNPRAPHAGHGAAAAARDPRPSGTLAAEAAVVYDPEPAAVGPTRTSTTPARVTARETPEVTATIAQRIASDGLPHPNLLQRSVLRRGDAEAALAASTHVVSATWETQRIEHLFLEPESCLAVPLWEAATDGAASVTRPGATAAEPSTHRHPDGPADRPTARAANQPGDPPHQGLPLRAHLASPPGPPRRLKLFTQGQGIFDDRRQVASFLGLAPEQVEVELVPNGGAFGGKEDLSIQAHAALLAWHTGQAVRLTLSREESIRIHPKRHPITIELAAGCDAAGNLTAVRARLLGDSGAYASVGGKVLERAAAHACGPYRVPAVDVEALAVYTNNPPCGAMRGFGANQAAFAIEGALDLLAERAGLDRFEIRWRNALVAGDTFATGQVLHASVGIRQTLAAVRPAWERARASGRAAGIACGVKNSGIGNGAREWGRARLAVEPDGTVSLYNGYTEMGQGLFTVLTQFAVEVTGLPAAVFRPKVDSTYALDCGQTTGSRATLHGGNAVITAARALRRDLDAGATLGDLAGRVYAADHLVDDTTPLGAPAPAAAPDGQGAGANRPTKTHTAYGWATQVVILDEAGRVAEVVAAHDVGRVVNPALCAGQIEGAVQMGLGYALTEELPCEDGMPVTFKLRDLGPLRAPDMPSVEVILVEDPEPEGPFGAKGVGEIGLVPTAPAVAGALAAFDGIRRFRLPMKDAPAARAMSVGRIHAHGHGHRSRGPDPRPTGPPATVASRVAATGEANRHSHDGARDEASRGAGGATRETWETESGAGATPADPRLGLVAGPGASPSVAPAPGPGGTR
jgi:CO/xanthine dehydrogenase Mo-binding subunit/aerobic-type carbon monoxide dehydrogenase small subunit (CoxS/CutS family)